MSPAFKAHFPVALIFSCFVLFPFGRSVELPVLIMAIYGLVIMFQRRRSIWKMPAIQLFSLLALCIWVPMLLSFPDTYSVHKTGGTIIVFARLYLSGVFVIWALQSSERIRLLAKLIAGLGAFWVLDAIVQAVAGYDLLGYARIPQRLNGVFGETDLGLGVALPVIVPFLILTLRNKPLLMIAAFLASAAVEIMTGSRGGWISFAVISGMTLWLETRQRAIPMWKMISVSTVVIAVGLFAAFQTQGARARLDQTLLIFSGDEASIDKALSNRWTLWKTAANMIEAHPWNGVGVRAFRYAYTEYAGQCDAMVNPDIKTRKLTGAAYAHQIILEVLSEAGIIGLIGLLIFYAALIRAWVRAETSAKKVALPFALAALAWLFPLNTHTAFYSSQWSQLIWLLLALYSASLLNRPSSTMAR